MNKKLRELQAKKAAAAQEKLAALQSASAILDKAASENRDLTDTEKADFDRFKAVAEGRNGEIGRIEAQIDLETEMLAAQAAAGAVAVIAGNGSTAVVEDRAAADPKAGFKNFGEYARSVHHAAMPGNGVDQRLIPLRGAVAPGVAGSEAAGADGGFLVPPEFAKDIFMLSLDEEALLPLTDGVEVSGNSMVFPKDETTPWGTDGITVQWQAEAAAATGSKLKLGTSALRLKKLMALVPITDELLEDTDALTSYLPKKVASRMQWKVNETLLFGAGGGIPLGALQGPAAVVQAKDNGQQTGTLTTSNLANMISRLPPGSFKNAVWIINNSVLPALFTLTLGNYPIYLPLGAGVGGMVGSPYGTLLGRPILVSQHAAQFSSQADVSLVDLSYYQTITKQGGMETATSMHLYFDADATAFRTIFRLDGQPKIVAPIQPAKGATTLSPFIQLAAR
ncbi:MAG: phage major capsid protein [Betaproteobacteria bacterium]|nr:phage major capsid protein [Betaproteobacteria bacterium]